MSTTVRVSEELIPYIDDAIATVTDRFGRKRFRSRKAFVDAALEKLLEELRIIHEEDLN